MKHHVLRIRRYNNKLTAASKTNTLAWTINIMLDADKCYPFQNYFFAWWQLRQNHTCFFGGCFRPTQLRWCQSKQESQHKLSAASKLLLQEMQYQIPLARKMLRTFSTAFQASNVKYDLMLLRETLSSKHFIGTRSGRTSTWCSSANGLESECRSSSTNSPSRNQLSISTKNKRINYICSIRFDFYPAVTQGSTAHFQ